jgi:hypothetical protein
MRLARAAIARRKIVGVAEDDAHLLDRHAISSAASCRDRMRAGA